MSAWPQAVWITKQLKKSIQQDFEINSNIGNYQQDLNEWIEDLGQQEIKLQQQIVKIESLNAAVNPPIIAEEEDGVPLDVDPSLIHTDSIWFVLQQN